MVKMGHDINMQFRGQRVEEPLPWHQIRARRGTEFRAPGFKVRSGYGMRTCVGAISYKGLEKGKMNWEVTHAATVPRVASEACTSASGTVGPCIFLIA